MIDAMKPTVPCRFEGAVRALALCLALLAGGCGPGVGGTGTGNGNAQASLDFFGATAASVCRSELADRLACAAASPGGPAPAPTVGHFADSATAPQVTLRIEGDAVLLDAPCAGLAFSGVWGVQPGQPGRYYGQVDDGVLTRPATLGVNTAAGGVVVHLLDAKARPLLGPLTLQHLAAARAAACP